MSLELKLRCSVIGHEQDVRSVAPLCLPEGSFVSASRDVTARVWVPNEEDNKFREGLVFGGHNGFVSAVCVLPADDEFPHGLIVTGSNDHNIHAYTLDSPEPIYRLLGHSENVCALASGKFGSLVSGSWDKTARVWLKQKCVMTLKGHEAAVWGVAIMPEGGYMVTASADKSLKLWKAGKCEQTYTGHTDCVRGVAVLNATEFISCSNDATIRRWSVRGAGCLQTYHGHTSFIYAVAALPNAVDFVSCGEDRTMRVWHDGVLAQTVVHPTQSVWAVCVLPNGDIVTGASDAVIRVFTYNTDRVACAEEIKEYEESLADTEIPAQIGDIKTEDLVGPAALQNPGKRDGQTLMVRKDKCIEAYQWSMAEDRWIKVGNVVGGTSDSQSGAPGRKTNFQGKDYDYVFNVEIYEDKPALKLPYNIDEDPWVAAHNFLENNGISQMFLDQVANFILSQTAGITLGAGAQPMNCDPFTGGSRYVPGGAGGEAISASSLAAGGGADPFTGSSSYHTGQSVSASSVEKYIPETKYIKYEQANPPQLFVKLREFNAQTDASQRFGDDEINAIEELVNKKEKITSFHLDILWRLMQWPAGILFPVLDLFRWALLDPTANEHFCSSQKGGSHLVGYACTIFSSSVTSGQPKNLLLMLRSLCNAFQHSAGERLMLENGQQLLAEAKLALHSNTEKNIQVALGSFLLNLAVGYRRLNNADGKQHCLLVGSDLAEFLTDSEAQFRLLVAVGTAVHGDSLLIELARSLNISHFIGVCEASAADKVKNCAQQLKSSLNS